MIIEERLEQLSKAAASAAAMAALNPTKEKLQASALELVGRMIAVDGRR